MTLKRQEYDIIFAGGGTAACVAAGRLAKADPNLSILIIERGKNNFNVPLIRTPAMYAANFRPEVNHAIFYKAEPEPALNNREDNFLFTGGLLGGSSSVNALMYSRVQAVDLDGFGVEGWDYKSLLPFAKKLENLQLDDEKVDQSLHGYSGPVEITDGTHTAEQPRNDLLAATESMGYPPIHDLQDFTTTNGFCKSFKYIGKDGKRQDAAHCYVHPLLNDGKHPNLHLLCQTKVRRVLFEGAHAVGVEFEPETSFLEEGQRTDIPLITVKARKLVIVSAGALASPTILERSGVGNAQLLKDLDIPLVSDLPRVGEDYQDHHFLLATYKTNLNENETMDCLKSGRMDIKKALATNDPFLGWNGVDVIGKIRMTDEEVTSLGPDFKAAWDRDFANSPTKPVQLFAALNVFIGTPAMVKEAEITGIVENQYVTFGSYTPYPYSRGSIHIRSTDPKTPPKLITGFLADEKSIDVKLGVWSYKKNRDIYRRTNAFAGELPMGHPKFREGSKAALSSGPLTTDGFQSVENRKKIQPVEYDEEDDRAIEKFVRERVKSTWHSLGTCKIAAREEGGVVDKNLNVYGTTALKVADLSVIPKNVGANTYNLALIVGEKAADIIGKELGITV